MEIKLMINEEEKTFRNEFVSAKMLRKSFELYDVLSKIEDSFLIDDEVFSKINAFFIDLYNNQFTEDEFENGIRANKFIDIVIEQLQAVSGVLGEDDSKN